MDITDTSCYLMFVLQHFKSNPWVAGYNPINEPAVSDVRKLISFYARAEKAIRKVDDKHILFLDGNTFAADFSVSTCMACVWVGRKGWMC